MVFNIAFLLPKGGGDKMRRLVEKANGKYKEEGLSISLSGPWPPFSFCPNLESQAHGPNVGILHFSDSGEMEKSRVPLGVGKKAVFEVAENGLAMAVSRLGKSPPTDTDSLIRYSQVVENYSNKRAVIPLRYGTVLESEKKIKVMLTSVETARNMLASQIEPDKKTEADHEPE